MGPKEKQKIEIEKLHWDPLPPLNQAVTADYSDFLGTALTHALFAFRDFDNIVFGEGPAKAPEHWSARWNMLLG